MKNLFLFLFSFLLISSAFSQNYFSRDNITRFADYLFSSGNYKMAAEEYERIVFIDSSDINSKIKLIECYKLQNNFNKSIELIETYFINKNNFSEISATDYSKLLIQNKNLDKACSFTKNLPDSGNRNDILLNILLLQAKWSDSYNFVVHNKVKNVELMNLTMEANLMKRKNPYLSSAMSALIPGLGKIYCNQWKDGLIALLFVAGNSWQAYRGFSRDGIKSYYGWIFAGLSFGFYGGNIYGSFVSAKRYNNSLNIEKVKNAEIIFNKSF